jgi:hypothetical protein
VREFSSLNDFKREAGLRPPGAGQAFWHENQLFCDAQHSGSEHSKLKTITRGTLPWSSSPSDRGVFLRSWGWLPMAGIARSIELYQLAYSLAWPYVLTFRRMRTQMLPCAFTTRFAAD